jgi:hypothetical protein
LQKNSRKAQKHPERLFNYMAENARDDAGHHLQKYLGVYY